MTTVMSLLLRLVLTAAAVTAFLGSKSFCRNNSSVASKTKTYNVLLSSRTSIDTLQQQIIQGATLKLIKKNGSKGFTTPIKQQQQNQQKNRLEIEEVMDDEPHSGKFTYYVREARRSEIDKISDVLMASFHSQSQQPSFDSYIRRYKSNHLRMCFDTIDENDRGIFVACASSSSELTCTEDEILVGFCLVDGRPPDSSCKIEFLTPSTLASTSPRPYLSDLGVIPSHRRQGLGESLVQACEGWADKRGYDKLYLKVEESNNPGVRLYYGMGYKQTKLPWARDLTNLDKRLVSTLLLEKSLVTVSPSSSKKKRKRTWIKEQLLKPMVAALNSSSSNNLPL
eukprot:scaffold11043_cov132-Skeletonema_menzelii.AAC.3